MVNVCSALFARVKKDVENAINEASQNKVVKIELFFPTFSLNVVWFDF